MLYVKDGFVKKLSAIAVERDGRVYYNVDEDMALSDGWQPYTPSSVEPTQEEMYKSLVVSLIRVRYSADDEIALLRQRDSKPEEFNEYNDYVESCKKEAYGEIYGGDVS